MYFIFNVIEYCISACREGAICPVMKNQSLAAVNKPPIYCYLAVFKILHMSLNCNIKHYYGIYDNFFGGL